MKAWIISHFAFVKEQKVKTNEEYAWGTSEHQVSGKNKAWKMWGREANDSKESHEDLASFQETLDNREREREREMFDLGTNNSKAVHSVPWVFVEHLLGTLHLLGLKCWVQGRYKE